MRDYRLYLKDIVDPVESIEAFVKGMNSLGRGLLSLQNVEESDTLRIGIQRRLDKRNEIPEGKGDNG